MLSNAEENARSRCAKDTGMRQICDFWTEITVYLGKRYEIGPMVAIIIVIIIIIYYYKIVH